LKLKNVNVESETMRANALVLRGVKEMCKLVFAAHLFACFWSYTSMEQYGAESHDDGEGCKPKQCWWYDKYDDDGDESRAVSGINLSRREAESPKKNMRRRSARADDLSNVAEASLPRADISRACTGPSRP
jgi:hypothetical protein